jgi:hypothetical protein
VRTKKVFVIGKWNQTVKGGKGTTIKAVLTEEPEGDLPTIIIDRKDVALMGVVLTPTQARNLAINLLDAAHESEKRR